MLAPGFAATVGAHSHSDGMPAYHSAFEGSGALEVCGLAVLPLRTKARGPALQLDAGRAFITTLVAGKPLREKQAGPVPTAPGQPLTDRHPERRGRG